MTASIPAEQGLRSPGANGGRALRIYLAGPLFSEGERAFLDDLAARLRVRGHDVFVPHEQFSGEVVDLEPAEIFEVDVGGVRDANLLFAWLDGPMVDDGTACEIGIFAELIASGDPRYVGIVGLVTDLRAMRRRGTPGDGLNLFVAGAIAANGELTWGVEDAIAAVDRLATRSAGAAGRPFSDPTVEP
jgi:Nucleoside 2-deoxyribosyltransferase